MKTFDLGRWTLVGPGAVGLYYGGRIVGPNRRLSVLARSDADTLAADGIRIAMVNPRNGEHMETMEVSLDDVTRDATKMPPTDCVIIAAKSTVNEQITESLRSIVEPGHTILLCLQNGMGNAEFFAKHFPDNPVLAGLCFVCVNRTAPGYVENYHPGRVEIGSLRDRWPEAAQAVVEVFNHSGVLTTHAPQLDSALWRKLCWNVPFNGLSIAAGGITTDKILAAPELVQRSRILMEEVRAAAQLAGHAISDKFISGQFAVTEKMGAYKPSSLIDYLAQKPVELESIWGEPLRRGQALGAAMPELDKLYQELQGLLAGA
ncbi:2-dehydropantoate 2-reductase [Coraliomargarita sp. SDUM461004]|uniref:2-dehydropantoate 2-reductase n=1 Tax=Thalassobacterium sedimentorum TaxID=3041258 RepID=A0ABU1AMC4_9BACT|nr:2-dehydropantoate 2-reductase [Coraliomargarita sp. SDUM461004]MDQ8195957.1 2-dehydropantoate 2-reductase [Coraliomargarita sp. SDUM461004]